MTAPIRRGACPSLSEPMPTGDGLLVRLAPASGALSPKQLAGLCAAAARLGNGAIEVTARGNIQLRGLTSASVPLVAREIGRLGILVRSGVPVDVSPLAGLDATEIADSRPLAQSIRLGIGRKGLQEQLGPKVSVLVDGVGSVSLDTLSADVRLTATRKDDAILWRVAVGGSASTESMLTCTSQETAAATAVDLLTRIAALGRDARGRDLGLSDRDADQRSAQRRTPAAFTPSVPLIGGAVAVAMRIPFGSADAQGLSDLCDEMADAGVTEIRPGPDHRLFAVCAQESADRVRREAAEAGLIIAGDDPRSSIAACPGAPACASGHIEARATAIHLATALRRILDGSLSVHVSGCPKGCAHPRKADLTIVGGENGAGLVVNGTAAGRCLAYIAEPELSSTLARLARHVVAMQGRAESASECLERIDEADLARLVTQGQA